MRTSNEENTPGYAASRLTQAALINSQLQPAPQLIPGRKVVNVLPPSAPNKGAALLQLLRRTRAKQALFIGDDDTDEAVFALDDPRIVTIRVGLKRSSRAHYYLRGQTEIDALLRYLVAGIIHQENAGKKRSMRTAVAG